MKSLPTTNIGTGLMWRLYACAWLAYTVVVGLAVQIEDLLKGHFHGIIVLMCFGSTVPTALGLALVWPLTGWLQRRRLGTARLAAVHVGLALAFGLFSLMLMFASGTPGTRSLSWYTWPFMYSLMMYAVVAGIFYLIRASEAAHRQALAIHQAQSLLVASELSALRSKLNPHFLFNTLHSIIALTRKNPGAAETALFQFSDMLRYVLDTEKSGNDRVTLEDELRFVRDYLDLEALRLGTRLTVEWDVDDQAAGYSLPALTLQPLVENSIKHAFNPHSRPGTLLIRTRLDAPACRLTLTVRDDGPGAILARVRESSGLGIRTVARRLELDYGAQGSFRIETTPGAGFDVSLSIPVELV
jgi:sensor histidine kinase YesM